MALGTFFSTATTYYGLISANTLVFYPPLIWSKFELWRVVTNFVFIGPFSFNFLMSMFMLIRFGSSLENNPFRTSYAGGSADHLYSVLLIGTVLLLFGWYFEMVVLSLPLHFALIYLWSKKHPDEKINFWGFVFSGSSLPWVLLAFRLLTGGSIFSDLCGLFAAHSYYFFVEVLPLKTGKTYIHTPEFVIALAQGRVNQRYSGSTSQATGRTQTGGRHQWGRGQRLG